MIQIEDIYSLTDFQRNVKTHLRTMRKTGRPQVLTVNGRAELVVQDAKAYQRLLDMVDQAEAIAGIRAGLESMKRGAGRPAGEVFAGIRKKHKIPRSA
ncbi:MAG: type II toxin-antitoxin system Phd/YefM family antitoxin [Deltaproteobacteria bacterium]|nr:type II toxin-antitoxin system Phd/YefM family antitoxin [Deltaproteobacteria bacterium]